MTHKDTHLYDRFRENVFPALLSKVEEFELYGYDKVNENDLWQFLTRKVWKRASEEKQLHEIVSDIMNVKVGDYMNYATVEAFKSPSWFEGEGKDVLEKLL